jgi:tetratricopeptide (TPR) repeat protein
MPIAVLPFNAGPNASAALARQFSNFAVDTVRTQTGAEIHQVNLMIQVAENPPRYAMVNPSEQLNEFQMLEQLFQNADVDQAMDGLLEQDGSRFALTYRIFRRYEETPAHEKTLEFDESGVFSALREVINALARAIDQPLIALPDGDLFGTSDARAFLDFLTGYDGLQYIDRTQGQVAEEFQPRQAMDSLLRAIEADRDWEGPYVTLVQLCRVCTQLRLGRADDIVEALRKASDLAPEDSRGLFALGELFESVGAIQQAIDAFEAAHKRDEKEPAILARLGVAQMNAGMLVNAERTFQRALQLEGPDKPSVDLLSAALHNQNRAHEIPRAVKELLDANPDSPALNAKYAVALIQSGREDEGVRVFDAAIERLPDSAIVKRLYAPYLSNKGDYDRAMDYYEDCLDESPADVQLLLEYAQTLRAAGREFEAPKVLRDVLALQIDPNTRAQVLGMMIEIEQPKRVEAVETAEQRLAANDFEGALRELKPLKNWLGDYWRMWLALAQAHNRLQQHAEAEEAATQLVNLAPGMEAAYAELVMALSGQNKNEEAYNAMRFAMSQIPNSVNIAVNMALAAKRVGRGDEARGLAEQIRLAVKDNQDLTQQLSPVLAEIER